MSTGTANAGLPAKLPLLRRVGAHPTLMHYHRLYLLAVLANVALLAAKASRGSGWSLANLDLGLLSTLVTTNLAVAVLIRQQHVVNLLFWLATRAPTRWPLALRWHLGKVYHFGGLHSGCATMATAWFALFTGVLTDRLAEGLPDVSIGLAAVSYALLGVLLTLVLMALPRMRARHHDLFEQVHRFGGWAALVLFWMQSSMIVDARRGGDALVDALAKAPSCWVLLLLTASIALPWLRLRRVAVRITTPSRHAAIVRFQHTTPFAGSSTAISRNPLREWHSFANIPAPGEQGFRLVISRAGDWTGQFIDDAPSHVWVKGITTAGVANIETLFKRVVYVATGSGIGPVLPHILAQRVPSCLVWSTKNPRQTYGDALVDEILAAVPDALIWNTDQQGKPDLVKLAHAAHHAFGAEAVICIANQKLTRQVLHEMESRGIPGYGAIWDS